MKKLSLVIVLLLPFFMFSQDDLLNSIDSTAVNEKVESAFKGLKIVNFESTKLASKGDLYFIVAHRFGSTKGGFKTFFGLDDAITQLKFVYGLSNWLTVSAARSEPAYDFSAKYNIMSQIKDGFPVAIVGFSSLAINIDKSFNETNYPKMEFNDRLIYVGQLLISRKINTNLSLEFAPSFLHENFVYDDEQENSQFIMGFGGRYKFAKRWSVNCDYGARLNPAVNSPFQNPLSVGFDLETGGHVFQMHFSNSQGIHEAGFLGNSTGDWTKGEVFFGFNLLRVF